MAHFCTRTNIVLFVEIVGGKVQGCTLWTKDLARIFAPAHHPFWPTRPARPRFTRTRTASHTYAPRKAPNLNRSVTHFTATSESLASALHPRRLTSRPGATPLPRTGPNPSGTLGPPRPEPRPPTARPGPLGGLPLRHFPRIRHAASRYNHAPARLVHA